VEKENDCKGEKEKGKERNALLFFKRGRWKMLFGPLGVGGGGGGALRCPYLHKHSKNGEIRTRGGRNGVHALIRGKLDTEK